MAKHRLLMRPDETLNGVAWEYFNIEKYSSAESTLLNDIETPLDELSGESKFYKNITSFTRSNTEPTSDITTIRLDDTSLSQNPIYAWIDPNTGTGTDILWYSASDKIYLSESSDSLFKNFSSLPSLDMTVFDASRVTNAYRMFFGCSLLTSLNLSGFNTSNVDNMYGMFDGCSSITELDLSSFDVTNVTRMDYMFNDCTSLVTLNISNFNNTTVNDIGDMFTGTDALTTIICSEETEQWIRNNSSGMGITINNITFTRPS